MAAKQRIESAAGQGSPTPPPHSHAGEEERHCVRRRAAEADGQRNLLALGQQLQQGGGRGSEEAKARV